MFHGDRLTSDKSPLTSSSSRQSRVFYHLVLSFLFFFFSFLFSLLSHLGAQLLPASFPHWVGNFWVRGPFSGCVLSASAVSLPLALCLILYMVFAFPLVALAPLT